MKDGIVGRGAPSNFVLLDLRFIILIAEQCDKSKKKKINNRMKTGRNKSNHITRRRICVIQRCVAMNTMDKFRH